MRQVKRSPDGFLWSYGGPETDDHLAFGGHEPGLAIYMTSMADPNKAYINVGAHIGTWAIRMHDKASQVFAFEANPHTMETLSANIAYNSLAEKVTPVCRPVWDRDGLYFVLTDVQGKQTGGSTRVTESEAASGAAMTNSSTTLDRFFEHDDTPIGLISMDVEGAEAHVLRGAHRILTKDRPNLIIELHEGHPGAALDLRVQVYSVLAQHNYEYFSVNVAPPEEHIIARPAETLEEFKEVV